MPIERDDVIELLSRLVSIESINPSLVPGGGGEGAIAEYIAAWLQEAGLEVETPEAAPGRPNVVGRVRGRGGGKSLILNAHVDTVGVTGMPDPFLARVEGDRLYGRGSYDMKSGLAAVMLAAAEVARQGGAGGDVIVTAVADEEYASQGTEAVVRSCQADGAIVTEPTGLRLCAAHKGFAWIGIETRGRAAHGSKPELGVDAIAHMGRVLVRLEELNSRIRAGDAHALLATGSLHASLIEGGQELSSYPERCRLEVERRTIPGETRETVMREMTEILDALAAADPQFSAATELLFWRDPFEVSLEEAIVRAVQGAATGVLGQEPEVYGDTPWMDAALLSAAGIPTVVFGPGGEGAHAVEEWASISQTQECARVLAAAAMTFCSTQTEGAP